LFAEKILNPPDRSR